MELGLGLWLVMVGYGWVRVGVRDGVRDGVMVGVRDGVRAAQGPGLSCQGRL